MTDINGFIAEWRSHRNVLPQMLEQVTDEQLGMKPWEKAMSLSELVVHIAGSMVMFAATVANGAYMPGGKPASLHTGRCPREMGSPHRCIPFQRRKSNKMVQR
ncbi:hypothetical protein ACLBWT_14975 [Paenibacillus sp. D51F]